MSHQFFCITSDFICMKKCLRTYLFFFSCTFISSLSFSQSGEWTWMHGTNVSGFQGTWGSIGIAASTNKPPSSYECAHWKDDSGNFWMFGGYSGSDTYSALWKYDPVNNEWTWMKGPNTLSQAGSYGTLGLPSPTNNPGARGWGMQFWKDINGDFWIYGGSGYDAAGINGDLDDIWKYSVATDEWTWMGGSNSAFSVTPVWGNFQTFASTNIPGGREESTASWVDTSGNLWFFGGNSIGYYNAVWEYDVGINQWAWMNGSNFTNSPSSYGTQGVFSTSNHPDARYAYCTWVDHNGNFWLFGGGQSTFGYADLWEFDPAIKQWTWVGGSNIQNASGSYVSQCDTASIYLPHARLENTTRWLDDCGNVWMYGGMDYNSNGNFLSDLWVLSTQYTWSWVTGPSTFNEFPTYGSMGVSSPTNTPGSRFGAAAWRDADGNLWLYGGWGGNFDIYGDLWKYVIDTTCPALINCNNIAPSFGATDNSICQKFCVDFYDSSTVATSWLWLFPGGTPSSSTDQNPANICYQVPGIYDVTLITTSTSGVDTTVLAGYITVNPTPPFPSITQSGYTLTSSAAALYQWQLNGVNIPGATNQSYDVMQSGYYTIFITDQNGCSSAATTYVLIEGIEELLPETSIMIYPNPNDGVFVLDFSKASLRINHSVVKIYNTLGQVVFESEEMFDSFHLKKEIDLQRVSKGTYLIEIKNENIFVKKKIFITE